jgi:hypothetical protein
MVVVAPARAGLYMAALVAARHNPILRDFIADCALPVNQPKLLSPPHSRRPGRCGTRSWPWCRRWGWGRSRRRCGSRSWPWCRCRTSCNGRSWCGRGQSIRSPICVNGVHPGTVYLGVKRSVNCPTIGRNVAHGYGKRVDHAGGVNIDLFLAATECQGVRGRATGSPSEGNS